jgi:hypothetical protein
MEKVFAEIGFGNETFLSTEFEKNNSEHRVPKFILPNKIEELYFRVWLLKKVYILSSKYGFYIMKKNRSKFKILFGIGGI